MGLLFPLHFGEIGEHNSLNSVELLKIHIHIQIQLNVEKTGKIFWLKFKINFFSSVFHAEGIVENASARPNSFAYI